MKDIYELIVKKSKDGIWVTDKNDVIIFTNKSLEKIAGVPGSEILNKNVLKDFPNETTEDFIHFYIKAKTTLKSVSYEAKVVTPSGRDTWQTGQLTPKVTKKIFDGIICTVKDITESKESEEMLREKTEIVNTIVESSPMGIHMYSLKSNGKLIFIGANPAADMLLNVDNKQFIGKTIEQAFPPLAKTEIPEKYSLAASKGISWQTEQINYEDNKISGAFEVHAFQISPGKMVALFQDITKRKQIVEALKSSEKRLNILFDFAPDAIFLVDNKGTFVDGNKAAEELMGYKKEELIGKSFLKLKLLSAKDLIKATKSLMKSVQRKSTGPDEYNLIHKDGSQIPVEIRTHPITINNKKINLGIARNITKRKQANEEMQKLAAVVKYSSELINLSTLDGKMIFLNEFGCKMLGIEPHEVEKKYIMEVIPEHLKGLVEKELIPALMKEGSWEGDLQYRNIKTSELTDVHAMTFIIKDTDRGKPQFLANVSLDITKRKQAEEKLKSRNSELEVFYEAAINRELTMIELKKEINDLLEGKGEKPKYKIIR